MSRSDDLLGFLVEELNSPQRDLVTRAFYKFAEGDPESGPVNEAILLTACSRRLAQAPKELRESVAEFKKLLAEGREMEARMHQRVASGYAEIITSLKDEAARAAAHFQATAQHSEQIVAAGRDISGTMQTFVAEGGSLLTNLQLIQARLKDHGDSSKKIAEATRNNLYVNESNHALVLTLTKMACVSWTTIGAVVGSVVTFVALQLPWGLALILAAITLGLLQWLALIARAAMTARTE